MKASKLWNEVFDSYVPEENRIKKIFDEKSEWNKRLLKYAVEFEKYDEDLMVELPKLGFENEYCLNNSSQGGTSTEYLFHDEQGELLRINDLGDIMTAQYIGHDFCEEWDGDIGSNKRSLITWLKKIQHKTVDDAKFYKICHNILENRTAVISGYSDKELLVYYKPNPFGDLLYLYYDFEDNTFSICMVKDNYDQSYPTVGTWYPDRIVNQGITIDSVIKFIKINDFDCLLEGVEE